MLPASRTCGYTTCRTALPLYQHFPPPIIGELLGHATPAMTSRYAHIFMDASSGRPSSAWALLSKPPVRSRCQHLDRCRCGGAGVAGRGNDGNALPLVPVVQPPVRG